MGLNSCHSYPLLFFNAFRDVAPAFKAADTSATTYRSASSVPSAGSVLAAGVLVPLPLAFVPPHGDESESAADWGNDPIMAAHKVSRTAHKVSTFPPFFHIIIFIYSYFSCFPN